MMTLMANEFVPSVSDDDGEQGIVLITDATVLVRPRTRPGYPDSVDHDTSHAYGILDMGDTGDRMCWHIATGLNPQEAHKLLDRVFYAYVDGYCMGKIWVDAIVYYIGEDGVIVDRKEYGFSDGENTLVFYVYTRNFWANGDPTDSTWNALLDRIIPDGDHDRSRVIGIDEIEETLAHITPGTHDQSIIVVRPDESATDGYTARGFRV